MVKVACFQATVLDAHVVVVVGSECLCSILKYYYCFHALQQEEELDLGMTRKGLSAL